MDIGKPQRVTEEPTPVRAPPIRIPVKPWPVKEPVPVRPMRREEPERLIPVRQIGNELVELPYSCPKCQRELVDEDGILACPVHGLVLDYEALK